MQNRASLIVVLGTGGTIAGTAPSAADDSAYTAAQLSIAELLAAVPELASVPIESEQVAQVDSKDMSHAIWQALARRVAHHTARAEVSGVVITHGTDTLEETAYFLQRVLAPAKPVVLTGAMRPATSARADGPGNLRDAVRVALASGRVGRAGVVAVLAGQVHGARQVRKAHPTRLDAFDSGEAGPLGVVQGDGVSWRSDPADHAPAEAPCSAALSFDVARWPRVEIVVSHAGAGGAMVQALVGDGVQGLVVAATGNGTVHQALEAALRAAQAQGVAVRRSVRSGDGRVSGPGAAGLPGAGDLSPVKARIDLMLALMPSMPA
ncbi:MAG: L-asparaginase [Burkholderiales bacterium PBB1]|nr:MAG: L-asparaginase [Burkholderiales bacterium PBB1]